MYFLLLSLIVLGATARSFIGDKLISVTPTTRRQLDFLRYVEQNTDVDFWTHPTRIGAAVDIRVQADEFANVGRSFAAFGMAPRLLNNDIQSVIDREKDHAWLLQTFQTADVLNRYASHQEIASWLESVSYACGSRCTLLPFGKSLEDRDMTVIKIVGSDRPGKPAVFVDGGIHAREWISPAFVNNMINKLINDYGNDEVVTEMLDTYDWYIIPLLNPDGYEYSHTNDRMWRKNRAVTSIARCRGVDLNRNFGYQFGVDGVSNNPCSQIYLGPNAFSEPESRNLRDFLAGLNLYVYLTFHSYGQYLLYPWGYGRYYAPNHNDLDEVGHAGAAAMPNGRDWLIGNAAIELYPAAGASDDWAYGAANATYAYCIELPPNDADGSGFLLPESQIPDVVSSVWPGVKAMMTRITQKASRQQAGMKQQKFYEGLDLS